MTPDLEKRHAELLQRWRAALGRLGINPKQAARRLRIGESMAYTWNCGQRPVPVKRVEQLEAMKK